MDIDLIRKYNVAGPRYTSYPTVPAWEPATYSPEKWRLALTQCHGPVSLYLHLPYCESLCTFCGCHKRITRNHQVETPYINALLNEWTMYRSLLPDAPALSDLHLGGGTPSFFSPENLNRLMEGLLRHTSRTPGSEFSFEGHPGNTTAEHLHTLYDHGFRRVSFGVQDYDERVQKAIHRIQPFEQVRAVTEAARAAGYTSVSHDLVFGLPFQQRGGVLDTMRKTISLRPDRIAFYSYAHVPWIKGNGQRGFRDEDIPTGEAKRELYEAGRELLEAAGYREVGMDHFALPGDPLFRAMEEGTLHRNFMGYTTAPSPTLIGLGASAISDSWTAYSQNEKEVEAYLAAVEQGELPVLKGHFLSDEDLRFRRRILDLMCRFGTELEDEESLAKLRPLEEDGLVVCDDRTVRVTERGRPFVRNVCMAIDRRLADTGQKLYSATI